LGPLPKPFTGRSLSCQPSDAPSKKEASDEYQGFQHSYRTPEAVERTLTRWQQLRCSDVTCSRCAEHVAVSAECPQRIEGGHRAESRAQFLDAG